MSTKPPAWYTCGLVANGGKLLKQLSQDSLSTEDEAVDVAADVSLLKKKSNEKDKPGLFKRLKNLFSRKKGKADLLGSSDNINPSKEAVVGTDFNNVSESKNVIATPDGPGNSSNKPHSVRPVQVEIQAEEGFSITASNEQLIYEDLGEGKKRKRKTGNPFKKVFGKNKKKKENEVPTAMDVQAEATFDDAYQSIETLSDVGDHKSLDQNLSVVTAMQDGDNQPVQVEQLSPGGASTNSLFEQDTWKALSYGTEDFPLRAASAHNLFDGMSFQTEAVVHQRTIIDQNKGITDIKTSAKMVTTATSYEKVLDLETLHPQTNLMIEKVPRAKNVWYSVDLLMTFEELYLPGMDKSSYQTAKYTQLVINQVQSAVWNTADGRMFQVLTYPSASHNSNTKDQSPSHLPVSNVTDPHASSVQTPSQPVPSIADTPQLKDTNKLTTVRSVAESMSEAADTDDIPEINNSRDFTNPLSQPSSNIQMEQPAEATKIIAKPKHETDANLSLDRSLHSMDSSADHQMSPDVTPENIEGTDEKPSKLALPSEGKLDLDILKSRPKFTLECSTPLSSLPSLIGTNPPLQKVIGNLERQDKSPLHLDTNYAELLSDIAWILAGYDDIIAPLYCPSPQNYYKLLVQGPGVGKAREAIKELEKKYRDYEIFVSDMQPAISSKENNLPIYTYPLADNDPKMPCFVHKNAFRNNEILHTATVGTFLKDDYSKSQGLVFGATAAHAVLHPEEQKQLAEHENPEIYRARTKAICQDVTGRTHMSEKLSISPHNHSPVPVRDSPFVAYTHYIPTPESGRPPLYPFQKFISDIAILPVDARLLDGNALADTAVQTFLSSYSEYSLVSDDPNQPSHRVPIRGYIDINDESDIVKLRDANVKIIIEGAPGGKLQIQPKTFTRAVLRNLGFPAASNRVDRNRDSVEQWMIAPHFAFTTDKALIPGRSGAPLMVWNEGKDALFIIGLLMGSFKGECEWSTDVLYQAMPFGPALKQLMFLYDEHLSNLRPVIGDPNGLTTDQSIPDLSLGSLH